MTDKRIEISIAEQRLQLLEGDQPVLEFSVSTASNGAGERINSFCTPRGRHEIAAMIGAAAENNTVFVGRVASGEIYSPALREQYPDRDWILTRILWLRGLEAGFNQGGEVDTWARYIYIHGSPDDVAMGVPGSIGCIRMRNKDIVALFEQAHVGMRVNITE